MTNKIQKSDDEQLSTRYVDAATIQSLKLTNEEIVRQIAMQISPAHVESDPPQTFTGVNVGDPLTSASWACPGGWAICDGDGLYIEVSRIITGSTDNDPDVENDQFDTIMRKVDDKLWRIVNGVSDAAARSIDRLADNLDDFTGFDNVLEVMRELVEEVIDNHKLNPKQMRGALLERMGMAVSRIIQEAMVEDEDDE